MSELIFACHCTVLEVHTLVLLAILERESRCTLLRVKSELSFEDSTRVLVFKPARPIELVYLEVASVAHTTGVEIPMPTHGFFGIQVATEDNSLAIVSSSTQFICLTMTLVLFVLALVACCGNVICATLLDEYAISMSQVIVELTLIM